MAYPPSTSRPDPGIPEKRGTPSPPGPEHIEQATAAPGEVRKPQRILGRTLGRVLMDAGIIPPYTKRVIIDAACDNAVVVYVECYGDDRLLKIGLEDALQGVEIERPTADVTAMEDPFRVHLSDE